MHEVNSILKQAEAHCKQHGARLTTKRKLVLSALLQSRRALSAYELSDLCAERCGEVIPAMSIYRILEFLEGEHLVHRLKLANKYVACSHIHCDHDHGIPQFLICEQCSKVKEVRIKPDTIEDFMSSVKHAGFRLKTPQLEMNCLCEDCIPQFTQGPA